MYQPRLLLALSAFVASASALAAEPKYDVYVPFTPENAIIGHFSPIKTPVVKIKSGDTVKIDGGGGQRWGDKDPNAWLKENGIDGTIETIPALAETVKVLKETPRVEGIPNGHLLVGPIYVEGAEPGDTLEVRVVAVIPRIPYGTTGGSPASGAIPDLVPRPFTHIVKLDMKRNMGIWNSNTEVPLAPFNGVMATCPSVEEGPTRKSGPPGNFGGNLDCKELCAGSSLYLPVFQKGALFYTGDCHAAQGNGEITVNAIETANSAYYKFVLHKGKTIAMPRAENATHFITFGLDPDLNKAMRQAITETIKFLGEKRGLDFFDSYGVASIGVDFCVTQDVDKTNGIHGMIPKKIFTDLKDEFWSKTQQ
ncbi:MAG TPA: acetamidase/formamidase family protein [Opitutaceae bacterium]|nr:acetamidase/formamidase family protein [Opitutaceae bacterium]